MKPVFVLLFVLSMIAAACAEPPAASDVERELPAVTITLPPATTTLAPAPLAEVDEREADMAAQATLEAGLRIAREVYGSRGTFDVNVAELNGLYTTPRFVGLQEAASAEGLVYDAHDQRVTLYHQSESGSWYCIDEDRVTGTDYGLGDSFESALADCNDGITSVGWRNAFEADGLDDSAIENLLMGFAQALEEGDVLAAHAAFHPRRACPVADLTVAWPDGRGLTAEADLELIAIAVTGDSAVASIKLGSMSDLEWKLERYGDGWYLSAEACDVLAPIVVNAQDAMARGLLEEALHAVRGAFVERSAFDFSASQLSDFAPTVPFVPMPDLAWDTAGFGSQPGYGLVVTMGAPGHFFCAVESLGAVTGYGIGSSSRAVDSQGECAQVTGGLPAFPE